MMVEIANFLVKRLPSSVADLRSKFTRNTTEAQSAASSNRVEAHIQAKYTLVDHLTPELISASLLQYLKGNIKNFAIIWRDIRERDDRIPSLEAKRIKSVSRLPYEIVYTEGMESNPEAKKQRDALIYFIENCTYSDCLNTSIFGGFSALVKGMLRCIGSTWSVQEIVWKPNVRGLTAHFIQMPLECFTLDNGVLKFLPNEYSIDNGIALDPREWLVSSSMQPLGIASLILYYYKRNPLKDWLIYCRRYVLPAIQAKTGAQFNGNEWRALEASLKYFGQDWAMVTGKDVELNPVDRSAQGELPYEKLIDRCDRCLATLWRGADLGTMSAKDSVGASLQSDETNILLEDDVTLIEDTVNMRIAPYVINNIFGKTELLVKFKFSLPKKDNTAELETDKALFEMGVPFAVADLCKRYNRPIPDEKAETVRKLGATGLPNSSVGQFEGNSTQNWHRELLEALSHDLAPLRNSLENILKLPDDELPRALAEFANAVPELFDAMQEQGHFDRALFDVLQKEIAKGLKQKKEINV